MRFLLELIRTDTTFRFLGLSRNGWVALAVSLGGAWLFWWLRGRREDPPEPEDGGSGEIEAPETGESAETEEPSGEARAE